MIISASTDYRAAAERRLPPFLFHYIDGGAYAEHTLKRNVEDLAGIALRQRVLKNMSELSLETRLFDETLAMPVALAPVGLTGMYARRGEVQAATAAAAKGIPFTLSTVSVCAIEEVAPAIDRPMWFQLYVLRDRGFMKNALERAKAAGVTTLVFTVDRVKGTPLDAAARAACTSPRRAYMPVSPTGASATGMARVSSNSRVSRLNSDMFFNTRWRRAIPARSSTLRLSVCSA